MHFDKTLIFVDGENLVLRYQHMLSEGRVPRPDNVHIQDCFIWNQRVLDDNTWDLKLLAYYTSVVGDDKLIQDVREKIALTTFICVRKRTENFVSTTSGQIVPFVRKKAKKSNKDSVCDIAITVDIMRACYRDHAETIWLFSGDGDFIELLYEAVHSGKRVYVSAFSSGLNKEIPYVVDEFIPLEKYFFLSEQELADSAAQQPLDLAISIETVQAEQELLVPKS